MIPVVQDGFCAILEGQGDFSALLNRDEYFASMPFERSMVVQN